MRLVLHVVLCCGRLCFLLFCVLFSAVLCFVICSVLCFVWFCVVSFCAVLSVLRSVLCYLACRVVLCVRFHVAFCAVL